MDIREANSEDWPAISRISTRSGYNDYINRWGPSYLDTGIVYIAEMDAPAGFSRIDLMPDGSAWLSGLRVDPDYWRKGIGKMLTEKTMERSRKAGAHKARMLVENDNHRSRNLSEKLGFRNKGEYVYFDGGLDLGGYSLKDFSEPLLVSAGWRFLDTGSSESIPGKLLESDGNVVFVNDEKTSFHILAAKKPFKPEGAGVTLCSSDLAGENTVALKSMDDFPRGILYEMDLQ